MIAAIASGKGGTGKTTVAASLASIWKEPVTAVDLDVEEPNLHLFLAPAFRSSEQVDLEVPVVDLDRCTRCRACSDLCQYKAITVMGDVVMTFPEMCHGCGGCLAVCPEGAVSPGARELGTMDEGTFENGRFLMGRLRVGEAMSPPLMRVVKRRLKRVLDESGGHALVDAPPGVSCPAVSAVMDSDVVVLVTEPTPFGFHDFKLAYEAFSPFGKPMGAVINRAGIGDESVRDFCREKGLPVLAEIPYSRAIAEAYSRGEVVAKASPETTSIFQELAAGLLDLARTGAREGVHA